LSSYSPVKLKTERESTWKNEENKIDSNNYQRRRRSNTIFIGKSQVMELKQKSKRDLINSDNSDRTANHFTGVFNKLEINLHNQTPSINQLKLLN
jgi:hypothetical protein